MKHEQATLIGLDLGAFETTAVASNGRQVTFRSCVGSASGSMISERDAIVGTDWSELRHIVEPFADGRFKFVNPGCMPGDLADNWAAARSLARHAVSRVVPHRNGAVFGVVTVPARASDFNRKFLLDAVDGILDACLLVPSPVAIAYGLGRLERTLVVDVGAGTIEMALIHGERSGEYDQITLPVGTSRTDRTFVETVKARHGIEMSPATARQLREKHGTARGGIHGVVVKGESGEEACVSDCLTEVCRSLVASITTALRELAQGAIHKPETVILTGGGSRMSRLLDVISDLIPDANVLIPDSGERCEAAGALAMARDLRTELWCELQFAESSSTSEPPWASRRAA